MTPSCDKNHRANDNLYFAELANSSVATNPADYQKLSKSSRRWPTGKRFYTLQNLKNGHLTRHMKQLVFSLPNSRHGRFNAFCTWSFLIASAMISRKIRSSITTCTWHWRSHCTSLQRFSRVSCFLCVNQVLVLSKKLLLLAVWFPSCLSLHYTLPLHFFDWQRWITPVPTVCSFEFSLTKNMLCRTRLSMHLLNILCVSRMIQGLCRYCGISPCLYSYKGNVAC